MSQTLTCPNGHSVAIDDAAAAADLHCPQCGSAMASNGDAEENADRPKGLWSVMGRREPDPSGTAVPLAEDAPPTDEDARAETVPKGLWGLMDRTAGETAPPAEVATTAEEAAAPKSLWALMGAERGEAVVSPQTEPPPGEPAAPAEVVDELEVASLEELARQEQAEEESAQEPPAADKPAVQAVTSPGAKRALIAGIVAVPASALSLLPEIWLRLIGTGLGFVALMVGLLAFTEIRRSRGRQKGQTIAGTGIALGTLAMLLGPFLFTPLGVYWRKHSGRLRTYNNLSQVGAAVNGYYDANNRFPPLNTFAENPNGGKRIALHNWTTLLLPYLGDDGAALAERIDWDEPYDDDANRPVMRQDVPAFLASGSSAAKTPGGLAVTHFMALGGELDVENVGRVNVGVFGRSRVTRDDVTDGLEQTLIAGEIADDFPPWGQPGLFRQIGNGLNKGRDGFGNADRTGAMFLRADGSVKFFSNRTDVRVLRQLSTRNGREKVEATDF